jgi:membrane protein YqaA with SNARE-associated domain
VGIGQGHGEAPSRKLWHNERLLRVLAIILTVTVVVVIFLVKGQLPNILNVGYLGVFILSLVSSASIIFPVPGIAAVCAGPGLVQLFPLGVALLASTAESIGELSGYLIGFSGRGVAEKYRIYLSIERWMQHRGGLVLFLMSMIPNPIFDLVGIAAGTLRYPLWRFIVVVWGGKLIKSLVIAYTCYYGFDQALRFFGLE